LIGFFAREATSPRIVDVSVRVVLNPNRQVTYLLTWAQGVAGLAVGFDLKDLSEVTRQQIVTQLVNAGMEVKVAQANEFVADSDREHLPPRFTQATYFVINPKANGPNGARFVVEGGASANSGSAPRMVTDEERRVIVYGSYATVR
jgi:hypothetical protein